MFLGHFEDGVELVRIGIDPLGLFELFDLLEEVFSDVDLHELLIEQH